MRHAVCCVLFILAAGCSGGPTLKTVEPSTAGFLDLVTLRGDGFGEERTETKVEFVTDQLRVVEGRVIKASPGEVQVLVTVPVAQRVRVRITVQGKASGEVPLTVIEVADPTPGTPGNEVEAAHRSMARLFGAAHHELGLVLYPAAEAAGHTAEVQAIRDALTGLEAGVPRLFDALRSDQTDEALSRADAFVSTQGFERVLTLVDAEAERLSHSTTYEAIQNLSTTRRILGEVIDTLEDLKIAIRTGEVVAATLAAITGGVLGGLLATAASAAEVAIEVIDLVLGGLNLVKDLLGTAPTAAVGGSFQITEYLPDRHLDQKFPKVDPGTTGRIILPLPYAVRATVDFTSANPDALQHNLRGPLAEVVSALDLHLPSVRLEDVPVPLRLVENEDGQGESGVVEGTWTNDALTLRGLKPGLTRVRVVADLPEVEETCPVDPPMGIEVPCLPWSSVSVTRKMQVVPAPSIAEVMPNTGFIGESVVVTGDALALIHNPYQSVFFTSPGAPWGSGVVEYRSDTSFTGYTVEIPDALPGETWTEIDQIPSNRLPFTVKNPRLDGAHPSAIVDEPWPIRGMGFSHHLANDFGSWNGQGVTPMGPGSATGHQPERHTELNFVVPQSASSGPFKVVVDGQLETGTRDVTVRSFGPAQTLSSPSQNGARPVIARGEDGTRVVAWYEIAPSGGTQLVAAIAAPGSPTWQSISTISTDIGGIPTAPPRPSIAVSPGGVAYAGWVQGDEQLRVSSFQAGAWSAPVQVSAGPGVVTQSALAAGANGLVVAMWTQEGTSVGAPATVWLRRSIDGGVSWELPPRALSSGVLDAADPAVSISGTWVAAVWTQETAVIAGGFERELVGVRSTLSGASWPLLASQLAKASMLRAPSLVVSPSCPSKIYVAYELGGVAQSAVALVRFDGLSASAPSVVSSAPSKNSQAPALALDGDCTPTLAWVELGSDVKPFSAALVFARSFDDGETFNRFESGTYLTLGSATGRRFGHPTIAAGGQAEVSVAWQEDAPLGRVVFRSTMPLNSTLVPPANAGAGSPWQRVLFSWRATPGADRVGGETDLYSTDLDGARPTRLTRHGWHRLGRIGTSPDKRHLAFALQPGLYTAEADGAHPMMIARSMDFYRWADAVWSPDGAKILGSQWAPTTTSEDRDVEQTVSPDGTGLTSAPLWLGLQPWLPGGQLVGAGQVWQGVSEAAAAPVGTLVAYVGGSRGAFAPLRMRNQDGSGDVQRTPEGTRSPVFSPDGTRLAYLSNRDGQLELYSMEVSNSVEARLTVDAQAQSYPAFLPGGDELLVRTKAADEASTLQRLALDGGVIATLSPPGGSVGPATIVSAARGGDSSIWPNATALDAAGNLVVAGSFVGTATFGAFTLTTTLAAPFIAKRDPAGVWLWATQTTGAGLAMVKDIAVDSLGNVFVTGIFQTSIRMGACSPVLCLGPVAGSAGGNDVYVLKLNSYGSPSWISRMGSAWDEDVWRISADGAGGAYVTMVPGTTPTWSPAAPAQLKGMGRVLLARLNSTGTWAWAQAAQGGFAVPIGNRAVAVAADSAGAVVSGTMEAAVTFAIGAGTTTVAVTAPTGGRHLWLARISAAGDWQWATGDGNSFAGPSRLALDGSGDIYVIGATASTNPPLSGVHVSKWSSTGAPLWTATADGPGTDSAQGGALSGGALFLAGFAGHPIGGVAGGTVTFGAQTLNLGAKGDVFAAALDATTGAWSWAIAGGGSGTDYCYAMAASGTEAILVGHLSPSGTFGAANVSGPGATNPFIARASAGAWLSAQGL